MVWLWLFACGVGGGPASSRVDGTSLSDTVWSPSDTGGTHPDTITVDTGAGRDSVDTAVETLPPYQGPRLLSETELYADLGQKLLADGVLPYDLRYPLWSDGADKRRWLFVPPGGVVDTSDPDHWVFPVGTVAFKEFVRDGVRVETRRFVKLGDDAWDYGTYLWRGDGSDADFVEGPVADAGGTPHDVPERFDCLTCHDGPADRFLGVSALQLTSEQQALLPLSAVVPAEVPGEGAVKDALGRLHGNCGSCHREGSLAGERSELLLDLSVADQDPDAVHAVTSAVGTPAKHVISGTEIVVVPGDPEASQLWVRMDLPGLNRMPPAGEVSDVEGLAVVAEWIRTLSP